MCAEWALVAATGILAAATMGMIVAIYKAAYVPLRQMRSDSLRELVMNLMGQWTADKLADARRALKQEVGIELNKDVADPKTKAQVLKARLTELEAGDRERFETLLQIPHYFEMVSVLVRPEKHTEESSEILKLFQETITFYYELYKPWIDSMRERLPQVYAEFEKLYALAHARHHEERKG